MSERRACKLVELDRSSCRYEPRADHNAELREELVKVARQKPRYRYRRLHVLLSKRGNPASEGHLLVRSNQEWAVDFACDALATVTCPLLPFTR